MTPSKPMKRTPLFPLIPAKAGTQAFYRKALSIQQKNLGPGFRRDERFFGTFCCLLALALAGCAVGPNYVRPTVPTTPAFKEARGWTRAEPQDAAPRGDWWSVLDDPVLDQLEQQVEVSNQNLAAAEAAYRQAHAMVAEQRAAFFPTIGLTGSAQRSERGSNASTTTTGVVPSGARNSFQLGGTAS